MADPGTSFEQRWDAAWALRRTDARAALKAVADLRTEAEDAGDRHGRGRVLLLEGSCRWRLSEYAVALRCLMAAADLLSDGDLAGRAALQLDLGTVRNYFGEHDTALEHVLASLRLRDELDDEAGRADAFNNLGILFWERQDLEEAERAYRESIAIRERLDDVDGIAACRNNIAKVLTDEERYDLALQELAEARRIWQAVPNVRGLGVVANNIGIILHQRGHLDEAAAEYELSLELKEGVHDRHGTVETRTHLGRLRAAQGRTDDALELLVLAVQEAEQLGINPELANACRELSDIHEARGDAAASLAWFKRFHAAERAVFDERSTERLLGLQVSYQLARAEQEGNTDGLTGLLNRRALDRRVHEEFARIRHDGDELAVALLDLDHFKQINDTFGHAIGDDVLRTVAGLLRDHTRTADVLARYGGEEFVVLLPGTGLTEATLAAEQLCERVRRYRWDRIHDDLAVTVSIGVATAADAPDPDTLLAIADRNLYQAKHAGKDRVRA
jgi:diguanylate cyclase (GGDEF)-like protein